MRKVLRNTAILALPTLITAVHLSDMTPRAQNLPAACNELYTATISGCSFTDFTTLQCSPSCLYSLNAMVGPIVKACGGQNIQGQNLIVAFLNGVGPQQICHNAGAASTETTTTPSQTSTQQTTTAKPSIVSSTTTARKPTDTNSLLVDTSTTATSSGRSTKGTQRPTKHTSTPDVSSSMTPTSTSSTAQGKTKSSTSSETKTTTGADSSQTNLDDGSGGGSPFDTPGNMMNGAGHVLPALSVLLPAAAAAIFAVVR